MEWKEMELVCGSMDGVWYGDGVFLPLFLLFGLLVVRHRLSRGWAFLLQLMPLGCLAQILRSGWIMAA